MLPKSGYSMLALLPQVLLLIGFVVIVGVSWPSSVSQSLVFIEERAFSILLGIPTPASKFERRSLLRMAYGLQLPAAGAKVTVRFVTGRPKNKQEERLLATEMLHFGDIIILDCNENLNEGKTFAFFDEVARGKERHSYVMKLDDDSYIRVENLVESLRNLSRSDLYYGYILPCENMDPYQGYMAGMGYLLSWDLVEWIQKSTFARNATVGTEDQLVGRWLDAGGKAKFRVNQKPRFYDHPDFGGRCSHELTKDTILVHQVKTTERWTHVLDYFEGSSVKSTI